ncbi:acyltransferase [Lichenibacterium minor]|uniref:Acyltransferase n=2 Tax=Lichenibacterium minor TaxID=2316528 RepID=A0A4Q2U3K2_9HYPH|nr:acyltransferase [Lichenibacterium minor]
MGLPWPACASSIWDGPDMPMIDSPSPWLAVITVLACLAFVQLSRLPALAATGSGRLASIDGLRGLLAIAVFFHHFSITHHYKLTGQWVGPRSPIYNIFGTAGVTTFFMITGFLFFGKIKAVRGALDLDRFFIGRVFRIVPVYAVSVALVYLSTLVVTGAHLDPPLAASLDSWIFFTAAPINGYPFSPLINAGVVWTLAYEWVFYFSIPAIAFLWLKLNLRPWVLALGAMLALYFERNGQVVPYFGLSAGLFAPFLLGGLASEVVRLAMVRRLARSAWGAGLSLAAAATLFAAFETAYSVSANVVLFAFFVPVAAGNSIFGLLRLRAVVFLGEVSYDVYMLHGIVLFVLFTLLMPDAMQGAHSQGRLLSLMLIAAAGVVALSVVIHLAVERPLLRLGRRIVPIDGVQTLAAP